MGRGKYVAHQYGRNCDGAFGMYGWAVKLSTPHRNIRGWKSRYEYANPTGAEWAEALNHRGVAEPIELEICHIGGYRPLRSPIDGGSGIRTRTIGRPYVQQMRQSRAPSSRK